MQAAVHDEFIGTLLRGREPGGADDWLRALRARAVERANELSVPTTRDEDWRFTDLSALYRIAFRPAGEPGNLDPEGLRRHAIPEAGTRLVFVDGRYRPDLSAAAPESGVTVANLGELPPAAASVARSRLAGLASIDDDAFTAVNTAFLRDGAFVHVARGAMSGRPIHLLFVGVGEGMAHYPRTLVVAEAGSQATIVEDHVGACEGAYLADAVSEVFVGQNAVVDHVKLQREGTGAFHIARTAVAVEEAGRYRNWNVAAGGRISRHGLSVVQSGDGTEFSVDGLALIGGRQVADLHSCIDHARAHGRSRQLHKTVVAGGAHAVFNGAILVREGAQQTDSGQQSRNLLLSDRARVDAKPQLEIFADDVKCAHGAAVGQIDAEELFYLRSRGMSEAASRNLLTYAFAAEVVERIPVKSLVESLEQAILDQTQTKADA